MISLQRCLGDLSAGRRKLTRLVFPPRRRPAIRVALDAVDGTASWAAWRILCTTTCGKRRSSATEVGQTRRNGDAYGAAYGWIGEDESTRIGIWIRET